MKKLLLFTILLLISCKEKEKTEININNSKPIVKSIDLSNNIKTKIKIGDIIYLKPDSTKVIVRDFNDHNDVEIIWFDKQYG